MTPQALDHRTSPAALRIAMVASQLRTTGVNDPRVIAAMAEVPRERFLPGVAPELAYRDQLVPIGRGREANLPMATGKLLTEAYLRATDRVLLIGAAGGYTAAVLARIVAEVVAVESDVALAGHARTALARVATGLLHDGERGPEKSLKELDPEWLARQYAVNAIGPALIAKHFLPVMPRTGRSVFAVLSARVGSISDNRLGGWYGYRASKAALNQLVRTLAIEDKRRNDRGIVVALHPGTVDTRLSKPFQGAGRDLFRPDRAAVQLLDVLDALKPQDSGKLFAWDGAEIAP